MKRTKKISEEELKKKSLKVSVAEGSAYSVMEGFGLRYITPYAVALNISNTFIGFLSSIPGLVGSLFQIPGSKIIEKHSRKSVVLFGVIFQALMWLPVIAVGVLYFWFNLSVFIASVLLVLFYTLLTIFGAFAGPAWSSWMRDIVTKGTNSYFGMRSSIVGIVGLASMFSAGFILNYFKGNSILLGFSIIFLVALCGRGLSAYLFTKQYEPKIVLHEGYYFSLPQFIKKMPSNNFGKFVIFSALVTFAVAIASPFFSVYMLKDLNFDYVSYTIVLTSGIITTLIFMPLWGKFGDKHGNIKILKICGFLIFLVPLLWFVSPIFADKGHLALLEYLVLVEAFSGFIWAGFNLSSGTFIFYAVSKERLALCTAYTGILTSFGAFLGAWLGGELSSWNGLIFGMKPILFVFLLSAVLRLLVVSLIIHKVKEVREVSDFSVKELMKFFIHFWPKQMLHHTGIKRHGFDGVEAH